MSALLTSVLSQPAAVETLRRALASGRIHHAYLFQGPDGVGKERAAFGLAQALVCERRPLGSADACGSCSACVRCTPRPPEMRPIHPDVIVLERGLYEPAVIGRRSPEVQDISIDQVRTLVLARSAFGPYEGRARVFVIRRADELGTAAANALLKTLEEPGANTYFVLLSSLPDTLPLTIRSRTQRVRFAPLPDPVVAKLLTERGVDPARAAGIAPAAEGSMAAALALSDDEPSAQRSHFVSRAMAALQARDLGPALEVAEEAKRIEKKTLIGYLQALAAELASQAREAAAAVDRRAMVAAARHDLVVKAMDRIESQASAQLSVEAMLIQMRAL